jgi:twitching motility protein PilT
MDIAELLAFVVKNKASDLHLSSGLPPMIRVQGDIRRINLPPLEHKDVHAMIYDIMNDGQRKFKTAAPAVFSGPFRRKCCRWRT